MGDDPMQSSVGRNLLSPYRHLRLPVDSWFIDCIPGLRCSVLFNLDLWFAAHTNRADKPEGSQKGVQSLSIFFTVKFFLDIEPLT